MRARVVNGKVRAELNATDLKTIDRAIELAVNFCMCEREDAELRAAGSMVEQTLQMIRLARGTQGGSDAGADAKTK